jgi:fructokinase
VSYQIVGIGELLWDVLPGGRKLGGAPANFTYHAAALGAEARLVSRVGEDAAGTEALEQLSRLGVPNEYIEVDPILPTGTVTVELSADGQPRFSIHENVAWDALRGDAAAERAVANSDAICFGTLAQRSERSRDTIRRLVNNAPSSALRILDVNLRAPYFSRTVLEDSLELANILKLNETELPQLGTMFGLRGDVRAQISGLSARFDLRCVCFTRGSKGSLLFAEGCWSEHPGIPTRVVDTVGAGDAFTAAVAIGLLHGWPLDEVNRRATDLAAFVCSQAGGMPKLPQSLRALFLAGYHRPELARTCP